MKKLDTYVGREQTYLKHFFLEKYLERVALNIGWTNSEFVYIDSFSGPWRSEDEAFEDTSFIIAIQQLRKVRDTLARHGRSPAIRCIFIESDDRAFAELAAATSQITDIPARPLHGEFERVLPQLVTEVGNSFALTFIDPTGWTGFALETISPLLRKRGEVLVNFMFDYVNRFGADEREAITNTFDQLYGGAGWEDAVREGEAAMLNLYMERLKGRCMFDYAAQTRILKPIHNRTYFHLVYATRHPKGLIEFRSVEQRFLREQEQVRADAKQNARIQRTKQEELFRDAEAGGEALEREVARCRDRAAERLMGLLKERSPLRFEDVLPRILETPMIDKPAVKRIMMNLRGSGVIAIDGMKPRQRLPDDGCSLRAL